MGIKEKGKVWRFILITFVCSYLCWGTLCLSARGIISRDIYDKLYTVLYVLGGFMPSVTAFALIGYFKGKKGVQDFLKGLSIKKVKLRYLLFTMLFTLVTVIVPLLICNILKIPAELSLKQEFKGNVMNIIFYFVVITCIGGGINEEFGWRGFLLPRLQYKYNPLIASVIIGVIWSLWHLPLFIAAPQSYIVGNLGILLSLIIYMMETICMAGIYTWLFNKTEGSLLLAVLFHGMDNTVLYIVDINNAVISPYLILLNIFRIVIFILVINSMKKTNLLN